MRFKKGSALVDYVIPTAVIGLVVGLALFAMFESGIIKRFFAASSSMTVDSSGNAVINSSTAAPSNLISQSNAGGSSSSSAPKSNCKNNSCTIDFGNYTLSGIPENMDIATEATGSHGADQTDVYANILQQLGDQLSETDPDVARILLNLAKTTTSISNRERVISHYKNQDIKKTIIGISYSNKMKTIEDDLSSFGINGHNKFADYWSGAANENIYDPSFNSSTGDIYSDTFKDQIINNNGDITSFLNENPDQVASTMFGLWQDLLESNSDPEIKQMASLALSEISNIASGINLEIDKSSKWYSLAKDYTLRTSITPEAVTISDVNAAILCAASGESNCR